MQREDNGGAPDENHEAEHELHSGGEAGAGEDKTVSLADDVSDDALENDGPEGDETEADDEADADNGDGKPRRRSRSQRYRERIARLTAELEAERRRGRGATSQPVAKDDLVEPHQADFKDDYLAYDRAMRDFQIRRALRDERRREAELQARADAASDFRDKVAGYTVRLEALKPRIPDFDEVLRDAGGSEIRDDVRDLILGSTKGPLLAYYLAKHRNELDDINRMPPVEAARRVGNLEARIRGPNPTATKAKAPVSPPRGGASVPRALDPDRMSHEDYRKARADGRL